MFVLLISIFIALIIVVFAVQNAAIVPVQFFIWSTDLPFVLVIFCSVFAGALLMFFLALWRELKKKMRKKTSAYGTKVEEKEPTYAPEAQGVSDNNKSGQEQFPTV